MVLLPFSDALFFFLIRDVQLLPGHQIGKNTLQIIQLVVGSVLGDLSFVQHKDPVSLAYGGKPVSNHDPGAVQSLQRVGNLHPVFLPG